MREASTEPLLTSTTPTIGCDCHMSSMFTKSVQLMLCCHALIPVIMLPPLSHSFPPFPLFSLPPFTSFISLSIVLSPLTPSPPLPQFIGRPFLPPYWSLGFHLCRWGYFSSERTLQVVERMREYGIPQDTQWNDIDYMSEHLDFTYNHTSYATMPQLVENLHNHGQHYVVITVS